MKMLLSFITTLMCCGFLLAENDVVCPDGKVLCPGSFTCCLLQTGHYGCCPYENAVCCVDKVHCCPNGMICDVKVQACKVEGLHQAYNWFAPLTIDFIKPIIVDEESNSIHDYLNGKETKVTDLELADPGGKCLDGKECPEEFTCCPLVKDHTFGCCPYKEAVCCTDKIHCCPHGTICNNGTCEGVNMTSITVPAYSLKTRSLSKLPTRRLVMDAEIEAVKCKGGSTCSKTQNCCGSGCCPLTEMGDCCDNFDYCCPTGTKCSPFYKCRSVSNPTTAIKGTPSVNKNGNLKKIKHNKIESNTNMNVSTTCMDGSYCPDSNTCCMMKAGRFGCCPLWKATCCPDQKSCCPHGTKCIGTSSCSPEILDGSTFIFRMSTGRSYVAP